MNPASYDFISRAERWLGRVFAALILATAARAQTPVITSPGSATGMQGGPFSYMVHASNYPDYYILWGSWPSGLSFNSNGLLSGTPNQTGTFTPAMGWSKNGVTGTTQLTLTINPAAAPQITSPSTATGSVGAAFRYVVLARNYPTTFSVTGSLPPGLSFNAATGSIYGKPTQPGTVAVTISAGNNTGSASQALTITVNAQATTPAPPGTGAVAAGIYHGVALSDDGHVWTWGYNTGGQLGDGTTNNRATPAQVPGISNVVQIAAGFWTTYALRSDGTVWAWGVNWYGEVGDGSTINRSSPVQVSGLSAVVAIHAWGHGAVAIKADGTLWAWGLNDCGQLGDGTTTNRTMPVQAAITDVARVACGQSHTLALKTDGTVWGWGSNAQGQLGNGTTSTSPVFTPTLISGLGQVVAISSEDYSSLALKADGTVASWGQNSSCELGNGTQTNASAPIRVMDADGVTSLNRGESNGLAACADGTLLGWGPSNYGQLGAAATDTAWVATVVHEISGVVQATAPSGSLLALKSDGTIWGMGYDHYGQLGDGATADFRYTPVQVQGLVLVHPTMIILGGNNQAGETGQFNAQAFDVAVWNAAGTQPFVGTPVTFSVQSGGGQIAATNVGTPTLATAITINTDVNGTAQVYYKQPTTVGVTSQITAAITGSQLTFSTTSVARPAAPAWTRTLATAPTAITLSWGAVTPVSGGLSVAGYNVYRNGVRLNASLLLGTSYTDTTVAGGASYTYTVTAVDSAGNESAAAALGVGAPASSTSGTFDVYVPGL